MSGPLPNPRKQAGTLLITAIGTTAGLIAIYKFVHSDLSATIRTSFQVTMAFCWTVILPISFLLACGNRLPDKWRARVSRFRWVGWAAAGLMPLASFP